MTFKVQQWRLLVSVLPSRYEAEKNHSQHDRHLQMNPRTSPVVHLLVTTSIVHLWIPSSLSEHPPTQQLLVLYVICTVCSIVLITNEVRRSCSEIFSTNCNSSSWRAFLGRHTRYNWWWAHLIFSRGALWEENYSVPVKQNRKQFIYNNFPHTRNQKPHTGYSKSWKFNFWKPFLLSVCAVS